MYIRMQDTRHPQEPRDSVFSLQATDSNSCDSHARVNHKRRLLTCSTSTCSICSTRRIAQLLLLHFYYCMNWAFCCLCPLSIFFVWYFQMKPLRFGDKSGADLTLCLCCYRVDRGYSPCWFFVLLKQKKKKYCVVRRRMPHFILCSSCIVKRVDARGRLSVYYGAYSLS